MVGVGIRVRAVGVGIRVREVGVGIRVRAVGVGIRVRAGVSEEIGEGETIMIKEGKEAGVDSEKESGNAC